MEDLSNIKRSVLRLEDKVFTGFFWADEREELVRELKAADSHEKVYAIVEQLDEYLKDEFFDSSEFDGAKKMVKRWLKTWKDRRYVVLKAVWA